MRLFFYFCLYCAMVPSVLLIGQTIPAKDYSIGNRFCYAYSYQSVAFFVNTNSSSYYIVETVIDTAHRAGKLYSVVDRTLFAAENMSFGANKSRTSTSILFVRSDSSDIFLLDTSTLTEKSVYTADGGFIPELGGTKTRVESVNNIELFGKTLKIYKYISSPVGSCSPVTETRIQSVGLYASQTGCRSLGGFSSSSSLNLVGAIIGKDTIGTPFDVKYGKISIPTLTRLHPTGIITVPVQLSGLKGLDELYAIPPTITLTYNRQMLEAIHLPNNVTIDSSGQPANTRLLITPALNNSSTLASVQFRGKPDALLSESELALSVDQTPTKTLGVLSAQSGRVAFIRKSANIFAYILPDKMGQRGDTVSIGAYLTGTRDAADFGINKIRAILQLPSSIAQPLSSFTQDRGINSISMEFTLSTNLNTAAAVTRIKITTTASITIPLDLINAQAVPNAANFEFIGITTFLRVTTAQIATSSALEYSQPIITSIAPNPIQNDFTISYTLPHESLVSIDLYDLQGNKLQPLVPLQIKDSGNYLVTIPTLNLQTGEYRIVLQTLHTATQARISITR